MDGPLRPHTPLPLLLLAAWRVSMLPESVNPWARGAGMRLCQSASWSRHPASRKEDDGGEPTHSHACAAACGGFGSRVHWPFDCRQSATVNELAWKISICSKRGAVVEGMLREGFLVVSGVTSSISMNIMYNIYILLKQPDVPRPVSLFSKCRLPLAQG